MRKKYVMHIGRVQRSQVRQNVKPTINALLDAPLAHYQVLTSSYSSTSDCFAILWFSHLTISYRPTTPTTFLTCVANTLCVHIPSYKQEHAMLWSCDLLTTDLLCKHGSLLQEPQQPSDYECQLLLSHFSHNTVVIVYGNSSVHSKQVRRKAGVEIQLKLESYPTVDQFLR